jgi:hypothetical protein
MNAVEHIATPPAAVRFVHSRGGIILWDETVMTLQSYGLTGLGSNGFNYIALSNDALTETSASTTLSNEIAANGLSRAQGSYGHTTGTNLVQIQKTFTCATASQAYQKAALFTASSVGIMSHVVAATPRLLQIADTVTVTYQVQVG